MISSEDAQADILDQFDVSGPNEERYRVLNTRRAVLPGEAPGSEKVLVVQEYLAGAGRWRDLPLDVVWSHWVYRKASVWPPEEALGAHWSDGTVCLDYESPWDPYARGSALPGKLDAHALWRACFDRKRRKWKLSRVRIYDETEQARR